jgi:hypothetical protein
VRDHKGEPIKAFNGLFNRGDFENTPRDHFQGSNNIRHLGRSVATRDGINISQDVAAVTPLTNIRRLYNYPTLARNTRLVLSYNPATNTGTIYHVVDSGTQLGPILTKVGMTDFAFVPFAGRAYISPFASLPPVLTAPLEAVRVASNAGVGITAGEHDYAYTFVTAGGETTPSPLTTVTAHASIPDPLTTPLLQESGASFPNPNTLVIGATYRWRFTYSIDNNVTETNVGTASAGLVVAANSSTIFLITDVAFPATANLRINIYRTIANGASYFREYSLIDPANIRVGTFGVPTFPVGSITDTELATRPAAPSANNTSMLQVALSNIKASSDSDVTSRKVYRTVAGGSQLKLLTTIADNVTTTFVDSIADGALGANAPTVNTVVIDGDNIEKGLQGEFLYVYAGDGTAARKAAGAGLTGNMTIAAGLAGNVDAGVHVYGVVSETKSGYLSPPAALGTFTNVAGQSVSFGNVPVSSDANVIRRHIVSSLTVTPPISSNLETYELFFIPNGTINNNTDTFLNNVSFFDQDLLENASDLADNYTEIPAGAFLTLYHGRLVLGATYDDPNLVLVSNQGEPEAISQIDGLLSNQPNGFPVSNAAEFRDILYVMRPNSTMSVVDSGDSPSSWPVVDLEAGLGARPHAICQFLNSATQSIEYLIVATYQGISLFTGGYQSPELTWKIEHFWRSLNRSDFGNLQIVNNIVKKRIYVVLPNRYLLVGFFQNGMNPKDIQWEQWTFTQPVNTICVTDIDEDILGSDIF